MINVKKTVNENPTPKDSFVLVVHARKNENFPGFKVYVNYSTQQVLVINKEAFQSMCFELTMKALEQDDFDMVHTLAEIVSWEWV